MSRVSLTVGLTVLLALSGCKKDAPEGTGSTVTEPAGRGAHPWLVAQPSDKAVVLERLDREPYATVYAKILTHADDEWREPNPDAWDHSAHGHNAEITSANAFLAWIHDDATRAEKALEGFDRLETDYETHQVFDINIRMPHTLMGYTDAWDFLSATDFFPEEDADEAQRKITEINRKFYEQYLEDDFYRLVWLAPSQNNHPIRTAAAIGYVALAFPDDPDADKWSNWAMSELDYLWSIEGHYVQPDGGVSEGPFYFGFAWGVSTAYFIAADHVLADDATFLRDCTNRQEVDPWVGHGCVDGEVVAWENPIWTERYHATIDWSIGLRLPSGQRPPLADAYFNPLNGGALLTGFGGEGYTTWDWENNPLRPYEMGHGADLSIHHLVHVDDTVSVTEPPWLTRILPDAGNAVFRSDWGPDARWFLLVGENGSARKTLHDHVDGTSFSMAAYGEYLLLDPGYYKPNSLDNAVTAHDDAHNTLAIDGEGAPDKGLLTDFGDTDAWIVNGHDGTAFDYAEAHQSYQDHDIERSAVMVDDRYFVVADRLSSPNDGVHGYRWRLNGYAGYTSGGTFTLGAEGARWERELAGVDAFVSATQPGIAFSEPPYVEGERPHVHEFELDRAVEDHAVMDATLTGSQPGILSVLAPYRVGDAPGTTDGPLTVTAVDLGPGVAAWTVETDGGTDLVLLREGGGPADFTAPTGEVVSTDAELAIVRLDGSQGLIARGTELSVDGVPVVTGSGEVVVAE